MLGQFGMDTVSTEWTRIYCANENPIFNGSSPDTLNVDIIPQTANYTVYLYKAQLEQGTIPSDWRVAPEDTSADITQLETTLSLVPGEIKAAVNEVQIGGTNMIRLADGTVTILRSGAATGDIIDDDIHYYDQSGLIMRVWPNTYDLTHLGFLRFDSDASLIVAQEYTLSFWAWASVDISSLNPRFVVQVVEGTGTIITPSPHPTGLSSIAEITNNGSSPAGVYGSQGLSTTPTRYAYTFTIPGTTENPYSRIVDIRFNISSAGQTDGQYLYISDVKLELGNKPTAWSPHPDELRSGSGFIINPKKLLFYGPVIDMEITGSTEAFHLDETGGVMGDLTVLNALAAPNIAQKYMSSSTVTVGSGGTFETLTALCEVLNNRVVTASELNIRIISNLTENVTLGGVTGSCNILICGWDNVNNVETARTINGTVNFRNNSCGLRVSNVNFNGTTSVYGGITQFDNCQFNGPGYADNTPTSNALRIANIARVFLNTCSFYNANRFIWVSSASDICCYNLSGGIEDPTDPTKYILTNTYLYMEVGSAKLAGTRPLGVFAHSGDAYFITPIDPDNTLTTDPVYSDTPDVPDVPPEPTTDMFTATASGTYFSVRAAWDAYDPQTSGNYMAIRQGCLNWNGVQQLYGTFWFDLSSLIGKTVLSASLTLTRVYSGTASPVSVIAYITPATSAKSANPATSAANEFALGEIGNNNPSTETYALPASFVQELVTNQGYGIMLKSDDTALISGKGYSRNYCRFDHETLKPVLTVTYQ